MIPAGAESHRLMACEACFDSKGCSASRQIKACVSSGTFKISALRGGSTEYRRRGRGQKGCHAHLRRRLFCMYGSTVLSSPCPSTTARRSASARTWRVSSARRASSCRCLNSAIRRVRLLFLKYFVDIPNGTTLPGISAATQCDNLFHKMILSFQNTQHYTDAS